MIIFSFLACIALFIFIGLASNYFNDNSSEDYYLAGRNVSPWLVGLSAAATVNSGFMFTGIMGYTYSVGLQAIWVVVMWLLGDLCASFFVFKKVTAASIKHNHTTFSEVICYHPTKNMRWLRYIIAIMTLFFLSAFAAAQLNAGAKALYILMDWDLTIGAIVGCFIIILYCSYGGIRASIWTDASQAIIMMLAMLVFCITALGEIGGLDLFLQKLYHIQEGYMHFFPSDMPGGFIIGSIALVGGYFIGGFGVIGQPHLMIRFMTLKHQNEISKVRYYYYGWYALFVILTLISGFTGRILLPDLNSIDPELVLAVNAQNILPDIWVGILFAALFSAVISTADSLILSASASLSYDLKLGKEKPLLARFSTIFVSIVALFIALWGPKSVFDLVMLSWSTLASAFAPLIIIRILSIDISQRTALMMLISGAITPLIWYFSNLDEVLYQIVPGICMSGLSFIIGCLIDLNLHNQKKDT